MQLRISTLENIQQVKGSAVEADTNDEILHSESAVSARTALCGYEVCPDFVAADTDRVAERFGKAVDRSGPSASNQHELN